MPLQRALEPYTQRFSLARKLALATEILSAYVRVRWSLARRGLPKTLSALRPTGTSTALSGELAQQVAGLRLGRVVARVLNAAPTDARCLIRSLVLTKLLAQRGISSSLVIGVTADPEFAAHAWVEVEGVALLPPDEQRFSRLVVL